MATFEYKALTAQGKTQKGFSEGDSARQVRQGLRDQGLTPLEVTAVEAKKSAHTGNGWFVPKIKTADLASLTRQLYTLLEAGMPLTESLKAVAQQSDTKLVKGFVNSLYNKVTEGHSYAQALLLSPYKVSEEYIATIRAGEESGHLEQVLSRLADAIEQQEKMNRKLKSAMIYPTLMVVMSVAIIVFLMAFVVPKVVSVFDNMSQELPPLTQGMLVMSDFVQHQWGLLLLIILGLGILYKILMRNPRWKFRRDSVLLRLPLVKKFLIYASAARWARTLGVLLSSGVAVTDALRISSEVMTLLPLKEKVLKMVEEVREGKKLQDAMRDARFFPALMLNLVQTGEGQGQVDAMLLKGASHYEQEVESVAATLVALLEPLMIVVMGGVVLTIVLAIMLPIFQMNQMVGH
ncbi:type II secretion system inner membrane protein GspF [Thiosulfativibrio zosterae]|uniref:General secretion pathway protein F n=1 Tax=Thiosulfativibrio zosterae TaxID=2675053 RepID=A0A6F8PKR7_9GAMM|nr:type II secretion system inner membrane protein GspF [Thiosulfativibrio zosterae]BBP42668.1 type II secretion system protein GspF [Thiosulfativibrio zosterae]